MIRRRVFRSAQEAFQASSRPRAQRLVTILRPVAPGPNRRDPEGQRVLPVHVRSPTSRLVECRASRSFSLLLSVLAAWTLIAGFSYNWENTD